MSGGEEGLDPIRVLIHQVPELRVALAQLQASNQALSEDLRLMREERISERESRQAEITVIRAEMKTVRESVQKLEVKWAPMLAAAAGLGALLGGVVALIVQRLLTETPGGP